MPLPSCHWFSVTGSGTFLLLMMVMALFSVQSSMADSSALLGSLPATNSSQLNEPHHKWASLRNDSHSSTTSSTTSATVSTNSTTTSTTSAPSTTTPGCKYNLCDNCSQHSVCVNQDGVTCTCICELGYHITDLNSPCTLFGCIVYDNANEQRDSCIWNNSYCIASEQLCVCKPGFESRPSGDDFECQPIPGWTSSTTQATVSTSSSPPSTSTIKLSSTSTASSKLVIMITGILIGCLLPVALIGVVYCYCQEKRKANGGGATRGNSSATLQGGEALPGAYYRRQPAPSPPGASTFKSAASKSSGKAMSKQNDAQAVPSKSAILPKVSTL